MKANDFFPRDPPRPSLGRPLHDEQRAVLRRCRGDAGQAADPRGSRAEAGAGDEAPASKDSSINHCADCGRKVSAGYTGANHAGTNMTRCLMCRTAHELRDWRYESPATKRWKKKQEAEHGNA